MSMPRVWTLPLSSISSKGFGPSVKLFKVTGEGVLVETGRLHQVAVPGQAKPSQPLIGWQSPTFSSPVDRLQVGGLVVFEIDYGAAFDVVVYGNQGPRVRLEVHKDQVDQVGRVAGGKCGQCFVNNDTARGERVHGDVGGCVR